MNLRLRNVDEYNRLMEWWRRDFGALLAFEAETKRPLALLYTDQGRAQLIDPADGQELDFETFRQRLAPDAFELTSHLPFRAMGFRSLFGFALARGWRDAALKLAMRGMAGLITLATPFAQSRRHQLTLQRLGAWQLALNQVLTLIGMLIFVLLIGKPSQAPDLIAIGAFSALLVAFQQFSSSLFMMVMVATGLIAILPQAERARPLLAAIPEVSEERKDPGALSGAIEVSHVRFRYASDGPLILDDAWKAATQVGLADDIRAMPMGMQTVIMEGGGALSGGQRQRLVLARAIVNRLRHGRRSDHRVGRL